MKDLRKHYGQSAAYDGANCFGNCQDKEHYYAVYVAKVSRCYSRVEPSQMMYLQLGSLLSSVSTSRSMIRASSRKQALRRMAAKSALEAVPLEHNVGNGTAYNVPTEKIHARPSFLDREIWSFDIAVIGKSKIPTSEMRPKIGGSATCCTVVALHWPFVPPGVSTW